MFIFSLRPCIYSCCRQRVFMWTRNATRTENQKWRMGLLHPGKALHGHLPRCQNFCPCSSPEARSYSVQTQLTDSAATHSPHRTNRRQKRTQNVERVVAFLLEKGTLYPDARELGEFMRGLGGGMNKDTKRTQIMRQMKRARQMARAQHMHPGSHERHNFNVRMTTKQKQLIRDHIEVSPHPNNVPLLCDELQPSFTNVTRTTLLKTIRWVVASKSIISLSDKIKESVRKHVTNSPHPKNLVLLRNELETKLDLSRVHRTALYRLIRSCRDQHLNVRMTAEQKQLIRDHIKNSPYPNNIPLLCDELHPSFDQVTRYTLFQTIRGAVASKSIKSLSDEIKESVRKHVANSPHPKNLVLLRNELQTKLGSEEISRTALCRLVRSCSDQLLSVKMTVEHKQLIREHVENSPHPNNIPLLCDELQPSFDNVPRCSLFQTIRRIVAFKSARSLSAEVKNSVRQHVADSSHPKSIVLLCDELEAKLGLDHVHRTALYHLVKDCSDQHLNVRMTTEQMQVIRDHIKNSPHRNKIPLLCDELQPSFNNVTRKTLYRTILRVVASKSVRSLSAEVKASVRQHVANSPHPEDVVLLCDELKATLDLGDMNRAALYRLVSDISHQHIYSQLTKEQKMRLRGKVGQLMSLEISSQQINERIEEMCTEYHQEWNVSQRYLVRYAKDHLLRLNRKFK